MCRRGALSCYSCLLGRAIPQPMPLPQVPHRTRNIQLTPFLHVYILPHILHHRATSLPYSSMVALLDNSTPMPSQHALCTMCIYRVGACAALLRHHALWLLVRAKAVAYDRNHLHFTASTRSLQRLQDCTYQRLTPIFSFRFTCFLTAHNRHYQRPTTRPYLLHR